MSNEQVIHDLLDSAWNERRKGAYNKVFQLLEDAKRICRPEDHAALARIDKIFGQVEADHDRYDNAHFFYKKSLSHYRKTGQQDKIIHTLRHIADLERELGSFEVAEQHYREVVFWYRNNPGSGKGNLANSLRGFALVLEVQGKKEEAIQVWEEVKRFYTELNLDEGITEAKERLTNLT